MKKLFYILFLSIFVSGAAQKGGNLFENAGSENVYSGNAAINNVEEDPPPTVNPPPGGENEDELPIDDYAPLLVSIAIGLIIRTGYSKKQTI